MNYSQNRVSKSLAFIVAVFFSLAQFQGGIVHAEDKKQEEWVAKSRAANDAGKYDEAISYADQAIQSDPNDAEAYNARGQALSYQGQQKKAISDLDRAIQLKPYFFEAYGNRGKAKTLLGMYDAAIIDQDIALKLSPNNAWVYGCRAWTHLNQEMYDKAIADSTRSIELNPDDGYAYSIRGSAYRDKGDYDQAIQNFDKSIQLNPRNGSRYMLRAKVYLMKGEYDQVLADCQKGAELVPGLAEIYDLKGQAYTAKKEYDPAIQNFDTAIKLNPDNASYFFNRGMALKEMGRKQEALTDLQKAAAMSPTVERFQKGLAELSRKDSAPQAPANIEQELFSNINIDRVENGPAAATTFRIDQLCLATYVSTYHYNGGTGQTPGTLGLRHEDGTMYGPWQATGGPDPAVNPTNMYWVCRPNFVLKPGVYTVIDSHPASWSWNSKSGGGMTVIKGRPVAEAVNQPVKAPSVTQAPDRQKTLLNGRDAGKTSSPATRPYFDPAAAPKTILVSQQVMPSNQPQTVNYQDRVKVTIPAGLIKSAQTLTIAEFAKGAVPRDPELQFKEIALYDITLGDLHQFDQNITVEVPYDPSQLNPAYSAADQIMGCYWDTPRQKWIFINVRVDPDRRIIATSLNHLTPLAWLIKSIVQTVGAIVLDKVVEQKIMNDIYNTPNFWILYDNAAINGSTVISDQPWSEKGGGGLPGVTSVRRGWLQDETITGYRTDVPRYIQDLGTYLEQAYAMYRGKGYKIPDPPILVKVDSWLINRYDAYGAFDTVFNRIHIGTRRVNSPLLVMLTSGHELFHAIQHSDLWNYQMIAKTSPARLWWNEAEAEYAASRVALDPPLEMMGGQATGVGANPLLLECRLPATGVVEEGSRYEVMEHDKAHFIDYLVRQRGIVFELLHDAVMTYAGEGDPILAPLEAYLKASLNKDLSDVYQEFAAWFLLSAQSPLSKLNPVVSDPTPMTEMFPLTTVPLRPGQPATPLEHTFCLPAPYSAKLWAVKAEPPAPGKKRAVVVESLAQPSPNLTFVDVYLLKQKLRFAGAPELKSDRIFIQQGNSCKLDVAEDEVIYVIAYNTSNAEAEVKVRISNGTGVMLTVTPAKIDDLENKDYNFIAKADRVSSEIETLRIEWDFGDGTGDDAGIFGYNSSGSLKNGYEWKILHRFNKPDIAHVMKVKLYNRTTGRGDVLAEVTVPVLVASKVSKWPTGAWTLRTSGFNACGRTLSFGDWAGDIDEAGAVKMRRQDASNVSMTGSGTVLPGPFSKKIWNVQFNYSYDDPQNIGGGSFQASGTFDGSNLSGTVKCGKCTAQFSDVFSMFVVRSDPKAKKSKDVTKDGTALKDTQPYVEIDPRPGTVKAGGKIQLAAKLYNLPEGHLVPHYSWTVSHDDIEIAWSKDESLSYIVDKPGQWTMRVIAQVKSADNSEIKGKSGDKWLEDTITIKV